MKRFLSTCFGIAAMLSLSAQCSVIEVPLPQRTSAATLIVEGKVTEQNSFWNSSHTMIYTANVIELYKIFKGTVATSHIEIITEGGTVDLDKIVVEPTLELEVGQEGMFTCVPVTRASNISTARSSYPRFEAYASLQGFVKYDAVTQTASDPFRTYTDLQTEVYNVCAPAGHHQYVEVKAVDVMHNAARSASDPQQQLFAPLVINSFAPGTVTAGTGTVITIDGAGFGSVQGSGVVRFRNADDGGATFITPLPSQYISWTTTQIVVEVPQNAGTGTIQVSQGSTVTSASSLTVSYAHLNVDFDPGPGVIAYQTDHINDNGSGGYTWRMNTGFDADAAARASFMRAFETWRCNTAVNWTIGSTTSINDAVSDGTNIICFDNAAPLSAGILGVCYSYWSGCASGPTIVWYVNELDIIFDEGSNITPLTWEYGTALPSGSEYDFETVAVHELGHGHQLGHVIAPGAIMHYAISNGTSNRSLGANDLAGGQFVQAKSVVNNVCGPGAMSNYICGTPPVASFSGAPTSVCVGGTVNFTDQSTGTPTSWVWLFPGGTPSSSNAQNPSVTYSTPGTYNVSLTASNAAGSNSVTMTGYITVNAAPTVGSTANPSLTICSGQSITLSGTGASSYVWTGGVTNGVPFTPVSSGSYTVTGTDGNGCTNTSVASVTVNSAPSVGINASPALAVCNGDAVTLSGTGANSYAWTGGITDGVPFAATTTTTYTVTGTASNGCTGTAVATVSVSNGPSLSIASNPVSGTVCSGNQATLTASGAQSYAWTGGINNGVAFTPVTTTTYTVTGTDASGCTSTAQATITVQNCSFQTQLNSTWCGATNCSLSQTCVATTVAGASNYQFWFQNTALGYSQTRIKGNSIPNMPLSWISGLQYGETYEVRVRCFINGQWQSYGPMCTITMAPAVPSPQLANCAMTNCTYTTWLASTTVAGAQDYSFEVTEATQPLSVVRNSGSSTPGIGVSWLTGIQYGRTYTVRVRALVGGVWSAYGPSCTFTMQATSPTTQLTTLCNASGLTTTTVLNWSAVTGSTNYRVNIANATTGYNQTRTKGNNVTSMGLGQFTGLQNNTTYTVTIATYIGGVWNAFGPPCTITIGSAVRLENPDAEENTAFNFGVSMYPNPIGNGVNPFVTITGADQKEATVTILDLTGRVITTYQLFVQGDNYTTELTGFPELVAGMYIMQVQVGEQVESKRFVAE